MSSLWRAGQEHSAADLPLAGTRREIVVVGAGITGLATAVMLARAGRDVAVVEAGGVAHLATGGNTGKISLLQGSVLSSLRRHHPAALVRAYVDANRAGMEWIKDFADGAGVSSSVRTALSYASGRSGVQTVDDEVQAAREAGLDVRSVGPGEIEDVPFPFAAAAALDGQLAIDPVALAEALRHALLAAGGTLHTGSRVNRVHTLPDVRVELGGGHVRADQIVLATGTPISDRGLYFAKTHGVRSYCVSFAVDSPIPAGMYVSVDEPTRSIRSVTAADGPAGVAQLIVGGNGHPVGRADSESELIADLVAWTHRMYPEARETHRWSAQDYESNNLVPFVGAMPRGLGRIRFATGYAKWGLTNGPAAALRLAAEIQGTPWGDRPRWMLQLGTRMTTPADIGRGAVENAKVAGEAVKGWWSAQAVDVPVARPAEGVGVVVNRAGHPVGISTVDGATSAVSAVCPHLGGVLAWNDAELSWDCPLHASRFAATGERIEGPATCDLRRIPRTPADPAVAAPPPTG